MIIPELIAAIRRRARSAERPVRRRGKPCTRRHGERGHAIHELYRLVFLYNVLVAFPTHATLTTLRDELAAAAMSTTEPRLWVRAHVRSQHRERGEAHARPHALVIQLSRSVWI